MKPTLALLSFLVILFMGCSGPSKKKDQKNVLLSQLETALDTLAKVWYPKTIDSAHGGFWSDFDHEWQKVGPQHKMLVSQARHVWTTSTLALYHNDPNYLRIATHGFHFLKDHMWDSINGGFHTLLVRKADSLKVRSTGKSAYGNAFAIYGLATYYKASKDTAALHLAKKGFLWLEEHARDPEYGGYFDVLQMDGSWMLTVTETDSNHENFIRKDWKDQNSSIHLMESFTALYEVWPHALVKERLSELLVLIRDTITTEKGYLTLHLERDWTPVSYRDSTAAARKENFFLDHVSFGHDVETAFLLMEASHALGREHDSVTLVKAKKMVDHALDWGWDASTGGFYEGGYYWDDTKRTIEDSRKVWWTQAECLNTLLLLSKLYPDEPGYYDLFEKQWRYIHTYLIDHTNGGWYAAGLDTSPEAEKRAKAQNWKVNYHTTRSLINVIKMMKGEFALTPIPK